jgi:ubiquinone/menaquinone biosynthesis C-methylase UbiE
MVQQGINQEQIVTVDSESVAEIARITKWQQLVMQSMGGLFPERSDLSTTQHVLDIACGPGIWALEVAFTYAQMKVVGIDPNRTLTRYAQVQARTQGLENVDFQVMDALHNLDFPDHTFDLINAQFVNNRIPLHAWPAFLRDSQRVLRPGGSMRITASELVVTNSKAYEELLRLHTIALYRAGYCAAAHGYYTGTTALLSRALRQAHYQQVQYHAHVIDLSKGTYAFEHHYANFVVLMQLIKPFLLKMEVVTEEHFEALCREATIDLLSDNYCGMWYFLTLWGEAPLSNLDSQE